MVTDRTQADVDYARENKDSATPLKGAYNYTDLNRVEGKVEELETLLSTYGYLDEDLTTKTDWNYTDFFTPNNATRYLQNIEKIRNSIALTESTPDAPRYNGRI